MATKRRMRRARWGAYCAAFVAGLLAGTTLVRADAPADAHTTAANTALALDAPPVHADGSANVTEKKATLAAAPVAHDASSRVPEHAAQENDARPRVNAASAAPPGGEVESAPAPVSHGAPVVPPAPPAAEAVSIPRRSTAVRGAAGPVASRNAGESDRGSLFWGISHQNAPWYRNTWVGLAAVLALIFLGARLLRRFLPTAQRVKSNGVRVLGRTPLGPKHAALLLHVGQRVILVGQTADRLQTLGEFTDAAEVAVLLGKTVSPANPTADGFARELAGKFEAYDDAPVTRADDMVAANESLERASGQLTNLVNRLRALQVDAR